jgi:hypothetical protein
MSVLQKVSNVLVKPLENAAVSYLIIKTGLLGLNGELRGKYGSPTAEVQLPMGAAVASLVTETVHQFVLPEVADGTQLYNTASMVLNPLLMGLGVYVWGNSMDKYYVESVGGSKVALLGALSEVGATYLDNGFVKPWLTGY